MIDCSLVWEFAKWMQSGGGSCLGREWSQVQQFACPKNTRKGRNQGPERSPFGHGCSSEGESLKESCWGLRRLRIQALVEETVVCTSATLRFIKGLLRYAARVQLKPLGG